MKYEPSICLLVAVSIAQGYFQDNPVLGRPSLKYLAVLWVHVLNLAFPRLTWNLSDAKRRWGKKKCRVLVGTVYQFLTVYIQFPKPALHCQSECICLCASSLVSVCIVCLSVCLDWFLNRVSGCFKLM